MTKALRSPVMRALVLATVVTTVAITAVVIAGLSYQIRRARLSESILTKVDRLVLQPPAGVPELEWAARVYWTHNLHCNSIPQVHASMSSLRELNDYLDASLSEGPNLETIDTLWNRYATISESGSRYCAKYGPIRDEIVDAIGREGEDYFDTDSYRSFLVSVREH